MKCPCCNAELPDGSNFCNSCGARLGQPLQQVPPPQQYVQVPINQKSRTVYRLLAFFLGGFGIHNFYAGYTAHGIIQLVLTLTGVFAFVSGIWALIEIFVVDKDAQGVPMKPGGCGCLLLAMLIPILLLILPALLLSALQGARESAHQSNCKGNLKQIGMSLRMYADDNDGHFPREMKVLMEKDYLTDPVIYVCPSSSKMPGHAASFVSSYIYLGRGVVDDGYGDIPIAMDTPNTHRRFINILYLDGHVRGHVLPRKMTSCVEIINELHPDIAKSRGGRLVLENAEEADRTLRY